MKSNEIDNILAFLDEEELNSPEASIQDFKADSLMEKEHSRLMQIDTLLSKKIRNIESFNQSDYILDLQKQQIKDYKAILDKLLIDEGYLAESKIGKLWDSVFS